MGPMSESDFERGEAYRKEVERARAFFEPDTEPHADPHVQTEPIDEGGPPPPIFE